MICMKSILLLVSLRVITAVVVNTSRQWVINDCYGKPKLWGKRVEENKGQGDKHICGYSIPCAPPPRQGIDPPEGSPGYLYGDTPPGANYGNYIFAEGVQADGCQTLMGDLVATMEATQGFCPEVRKQQAEGAACREANNKPKEGCCQRSLDPVTSGGVNTRKQERDQSCFYGTEGDKPKEIFSTVQTKPSSSEAPALYAEYSKMRYGDPIYVIAAGTNPPMPPTNTFVNVNKVHDKLGNIANIWAGQCPMGRDVHYHTTKTDKAAHKKETVCDWLNFISGNGIRTLVSLAPNPKEKRQFQVKVRCTDYIGELLKGSAAVEPYYLGPADYTATCADKLTQQSETPIPDSQPHSSGHTPTVFVRKLTYDGHEFTQIYFDAWPDAHGSENPIAATPSMNAFTNVIKQIHEAHKDAPGKDAGLAVHCAGGRGRTGTVIAGLIAGSNSVTTVAGLVDVVRELREKRADMVEDPYQFYMLAAYLQIPEYSARTCPLREETE